MKATITIDRLRLHANHGVMDQERRCGNEFEVTVTIDIDYNGSDSIDATVNYAEAIELIRTEMSTPSDLIEHAATRIAAALRARFSPLLTGGTVTVAKLLPPIAGCRLSSVSATLPL